MAQASGHYPAGDNPAQDHIHYTTKEKRHRKKHGFKAFDPEQVRALYAPEHFPACPRVARFGLADGVANGTTLGTVLKRVG